MSWKTFSRRAYTYRTVITERVKRVLLSISDPTQRVRWLEGELLTQGIEGAARLLDALAAESENSELRAREALLTVALLLLEWGESERVQALRSEAAGASRLSLQRLLRVDPSRPNHAEIEVTVPDYGVGRELTLGERRSLARRPHRRHLERLLADPHPLVVRQLLLNPKLTEDDVVRWLAKRPLRRVALTEVAASARWLCRPRVRLAIVLNPGSPSTIALPLLGLCNRAELREIVEQSSASLTIRATALEHLERRPPLGESGAPGIQ